GMKKARIRPRSCSSMCLLRIGDSPISTPATNAPSTVCTPMKWVVSAMAPMITRMVVITGKSLSKLSFAHRIREDQAPSDGNARDQECGGSQHAPDHAHEIDAACFREAERDRNDDPADRVFADRRGDDDLPEIAAGETH